VVKERISDLQFLRWVTGFSLFFFFTVRFACDRDTSRCARKALRGKLCVDSEKAAWSLD